jgi:hypothetical protein
MKKYIFLLFLISTSYANDRTSVKWVQDGMNIRTESFIYYGNSNKPMYSALNIEFSIHSKCKEAFVSVISMKDKKLGKKKSHDFVSATEKNNRLNFYINNKEFIYSAEKTIRVIYDNGVEFGTLPSLNLITALTESEGPIEVKIGDAILTRIENSKGNSKFLQDAKNFCLNKIR